MADQDNQYRDPIGVTPNNDPPAVKNKRAKFGKGFVIFLAAFGIIMFAVYIGIVVIGLAKA